MIDISMADLYLVFGIFDHISIVASEGFLVQHQLLIMIQDGTHHLMKRAPPIQQYLQLLFVEEVNLQHPLV